MAEKLVWSPRAAKHLEAICRFIAQDSELYAALFAERVLSLVKNIPHFPDAGRVVPEYDDINLREKLYGNYRIVYRRKQKSIEIVAICHSAQKIEGLLS